MANLYGCESEILAKTEALKSSLESVLEAPFTASDRYFHQFEPEGVTALYLGENKHFTIHSWPETKMAAMDILLPVPNYQLYKNVQSALTPKEYYNVTDREPPPHRRVGREVVGVLDGLRHYKKIDTEKKGLDLLKEISRGAKFHVVGELTRSSEKMIDVGLVLSESHFALHYNKENRIAVVDIFTCGVEGDPGVGYELLRRALGSCSYRRTDYPR